MGFLSGGLCPGSFCPGGLSCHPGEDKGLRISLLFKRRPIIIFNYPNSQQKTDTQKHYLLQLAPQFQR